MTLVADDGWTEHTYQTPFDTVPQVLYGMCGSAFDLNNRADPVHPGYGYLPAQEPNDIGVNAIVISSKTSLIIKGVELSFGDTKALTLDVCYHACSIGPGIGPVDH